ncbi:MAG: hypothetical protein R3A47_10785 [Polyangiales bacterium]
MSFRSLALALSALLPSIASAQVSITVAPLPNEPYLFSWAIKNDSAAPVEVFVDRRLLMFEISSPRTKRKERCRLGGAPTRIRKNATRTLNPGESADEWIDIREICWGKTWQRPDATLNATYRIASKRKDSWIAKIDDTKSGRVRTLAAPPIALTAVAVTPPTTVHVSMSDQKVAIGASPRFSVRIAAVSDPIVIYPKNDLFRFEVKGPTGDNLCQLERLTIVPIIDFFVRITPKSAYRQTLVSEAYCGELFHKPGMYTVTPIVDLVYEGRRWDTDATTGTFVGAQAAVWVRDKRAPYAPQPLSELSAANSDDSTAPTPEQKEN